MNIGYVRVSSVDQNDQMQFEVLSSYNIEKWFSEKVSAKNMDRPELLKMLDYVRDGDTVYIYDFSRIARSTKDLLEIFDKLEKKDVKLISHKENVDTNTAIGKFTMTVIGAVYEFERQNLLERQREGIAIAKREGKYKGGKKKTIPHFEKYYARYLRREVTKADLARELHISRPTLDRIISDYKKKNKIVDVSNVEKVG